MQQTFIICTLISNQALGTRVDVNNNGERIAFFFCCRFLPKDVAQPPFSITRHVILPLLLAEGRRNTSFFEDKCIATMINTCKKRNENLIRNRARTSRIAIFAPILVYKDNILLYYICLYSISTFFLTKNILHNCLIIMYVFPLQVSSVKLYASLKYSILS